MEYVVLLTLLTLSKPWFQSGREVGERTIGWAPKFLSDREDPCTVCPVMASLKVRLSLYPYPYFEIPLCQGHNNFGFCVEEEFFCCHLWLAGPPLCIL